MKKFCSISFALILSAALAAGCGGGGGDDDVDGGTDGSVVRLDGRVDARMADATVPGMCNQGSTGTLGAFRACTGDAQCMPGSQCLPLGTAGSFCFRCCDGTGTSPGTNTCDVGSACVQNGAPTLNTQFQVLENHCFFSTCGAGNGTGLIESDCEVGKDLWSAGTTGFGPGACLPFDDVGSNGSGPRGSCNPVGTLAIGATCNHLTSAPGTPQCVKGAVCIGPGATTAMPNPPGRCAEVCDPLKTDTNGCMGALFCQDSSEKSGTTIGTYGFCVTNPTCNVVEEPAAVATGGMSADHYNGCTGAPALTAPIAANPTCFPTTAARGNGLCGIPVGTATTACKNAAATFTAADFCGAGLTCGNNADSAADSSCMQFCNSPMAGTAANPADCATGNCRPYIYDQGADMAAGGTDDELALGYGVCMP
ncbi:MAG: hypothetical protein IT370_34965 [Deltaproteobacteria bacterium]|nr:hypothetical protein [Deltaproteobacteria bacterium]